MSPTTSRAVHQGPQVRDVPREVGPEEPDPCSPTVDVRSSTVAFVASLAVGLASAGWSPPRAVPELVAAADGAPEVLAAARAWLRRRCTGRRDTARAVHLLLRAEMTLSAPAIAS